MKDAVKAVFAFGTRTLKAEWRTDAGRINSIGTICVCAIVVGGSTLDLLGAVVRIFKSDYSTGQPSALAFIAVFGAIFLACVLILGLIERQQS